MNKSKRLHKHYGNLDADERFQLVAQALAREDNPDVNALVARCPSIQYAPQVDQNYALRIRLAVSIVDSTETQLWRAGFCLMGALAALRSVDRPDDMTNDDAQAIVERASQRVDEYTSVILSLWTGLGIFSNAIRLKFDDLRALSFIDGLEPVEQVVNMAKSWERMTRQTRFVPELAEWHGQGLSDEQIDKRRKEWAQAQNASLQDGAQEYADILTQRWHTQLGSE